MSLNFMAEVTICIHLSPLKIKSVTVSIVFTSICLMTKLLSFRINKFLLTMHLYNCMTIIFAKISKFGLRIMRDNYLNFHSVSVLHRIMISDFFLPC